MPTDFDRMLRTYAELTVRVGLNLQPTQRLLIIGPIANGGAALVIHERADDMKSDPAGNAGSRIACGVITK